MGYRTKHCTLQTPTHTTAGSQMVSLPTTRQLTPCHLLAFSSPASELLPRLQNKANAPLYKYLQTLKVEALDNKKTDCCSRKLCNSACLLKTYIPFVMARSSITGR